MTGWEFYHETGLRAALPPIFEKEWRERRGLKRDGGFPYFYLRYFSRVWILILQLLSRSPSGFYLYKMCFIGLRSRASLSISALSGRRGLYAHVCGICAPFYCISLKILYWWGYNATRDLISRDTALHTHFKFTLFLISILSYPFIKTWKVSLIRERPLNPLPFWSFPY